MLAMPLRILVLDDHPLMTQAMGMLLEDHFVGAQIMVCTRLGDAVSVLKQGPADLAIVDLDLPDASPDQVLSMIQQHIDDGVFVIFSGQPSQYARELAIEAGAAAFIPKIAQREDILDTLDQCLAQSGRAQSMISKEGSTHGLPSLSTRQQQVLELLARGHSNREVAQALHISENTIKVHLRALFSAIQVKTRAQAVARALELGLVNAPRAQN
jgi:two-component system, NarL family, nitrate/nitrite response regulator NarL